MAKKQSLIGTYIIIIIFLGTIVAAALIFGLSLPGSVLNKASSVQLAGITAYPQSTDGQTHSLSSDISVQFTNRARVPNTDTLKSQVAAIVSGLDYEKIAAGDGVDYVQDEIAKALSQYYEPQEIEHVYITALVSDTALPKNDANGQGNGAVMEGLFQNMD